MADSLAGRAFYAVLHPLNRRELLRNQNHEVIEIPVGQLHDLEAMRRHFYRIGAVLLGKEHAVKIRDNPDWHPGSRA
ncbi:MAG: hypothetical protein QHJ82_13070 [Verrucomicrobiota bacterium]|nr:hypothetical protein [Verrucomicrobiota bacterium]